MYLRDFPFFLVFSCFFLGSTELWGQGQLGVQISPGISFNRAYTNPNRVGLIATGSSLRCRPGIIYDYPFQESYYVSTGLFYTVQQVAVESSELSPNLREEHELDFLQSPLLLKLYTGEVTPDIRLYAALGMVLHLRVNERNVEIGDGQSKPFIRSFHRWGLAGLLSAGVECETSILVNLFAGLSYHVGWSNIIDKQEQSLCKAEAVCYNNLLSLDLGIRF